MNKLELVSEVSKETGLSKKDTQEALSGILNVIHKSLKEGESVQLIGFGTFGVKDRPARVARNPRTGESIKIAKTKVPYFKAGKALKDSVK